MKFAREFKKHLADDGYPPEWVDNAISYGQLKKCVKRVQRELTALGLDVETLRQMLAQAQQQQQQQQKKEGAHGSSAESTSPTHSSVTDGKASDDEDGRRESTATRADSVSSLHPFQYKLAPSDPSWSQPITPKLLFVVDANTGEPLSAGLSPETRNYLHQLATRDQLTNVPDSNKSGANNTTNNLSTNDEDRRNSTASTDYSDRHVRFVQVPLTTDSEFFAVLERELTGLVALQAASRKKLAADIHSLGRELGDATSPTSKSGRHDLTQWRRLLECYLDARVFFATNERDHGSRASADAARNWERFMGNARGAKILGGWKRKESAGVLERFVRVNWELVQALRFREINYIAMTKILKSKDPFPQIVPFHSGKAGN
jgi:E3 ubiquitin-protein ligase BAH